MDLLEHIDHLVLAGSDLEAGVEHFGELLGVRPVMGGRHPNWGTWNAILALGPRTYLELIAPDPQSNVSSALRPAIFSGNGEFRLTGWLASVSDPARIRLRLLEQGKDPGEILKGARDLPDGRRLNWSLSDPMVCILDGVVPVMIDWGDSPHPAVTAPAGCRLQAVELRHPQASDANGILELMGLPTVVGPGPEPVLKAVLETPHGRVTLD